MHRKTKLLILLFVLMGIYLPVLSHAQKGNLEEQILFFTNKFRKSKGKPPLQLVTVISREARRHSKDMAGNKVGFGHDGFEERIAHIRGKSGFINAAAENVAYGHLNAREVVDGWIKSPPHRKNLLGDYNLIGIGTASTKDGVIFFTQVFIKKK